MSLQNSNKKIRIFSAKIPVQSSHKNRPFSGQNSHTYSKKQLIENVYAGQMTLPSRYGSVRVNGSNPKNTLLSTQRGKKTYGVQNKKKQQLIEQIFNLKQTANKLNEDLARQKTKVEGMKKKNNKYSKILTQQFQDEKQWNTVSCSNHLVAGIRTMYDNLKQNYQIKCQMFDKLIKQPSKTKEIQMKTYINTLQKQINSLKQIVIRFSNMNNDMMIQNETQKLAQKYNIEQLRYQNEVIKEKCNDYSSKYKMGKQNIKDLSTRIKFLQKLIIEKDNNLHSIQKKNKSLLGQNSTLTKQLDQIKSKFANLTIESNNQKIQNKLKLQQIQNKHDIRLNEIYNQKNQKIKLLKRDNDYYQDIIKQLRHSNTTLTNQLQEFKQKNVKNQVGNIVNFAQTLILNENQKIKNKQTNQNTHQKIFNQGQKKGPYRANVKHSENSLKKRKVQLTELLQICQLLKYRLVNQNYKIEDIKKYFDKKSQCQQQNQIYITMKQTRNILTNRPFNLTQQQAILLGRYLIEDVQQQYVYFDDLNQNNRQVIKSIFKTLLQDYMHFQKQHPVFKQYDIFVQNYKQNLTKALKTSDPSGQISKYKLLQSMKAIGIQLSQQLKILLLGRLAQYSSNLNSLVYSHLF